MTLPILYEDADIVAVAKPSGLITHSDGRTQEETAEDWFKEKYEGGLASPKPSGGGYVHRLDRDTSGVLVFAKNAVAYEFSRKAFHDREVKKTYLALVHGSIREKKGVIDFDIGRSRKDFRLRSAQPKAKGRLREALTRYEVVGEADGCSLLMVNPETGRTHQIRVHLKAIHHPVIGDALYAPKREQAHHKSTSHFLSRFAPNEMKSLGLSRLGLHAYSLDLPLSSGGRVVIIAPVPPDLTPAFSHFPEASGKFALAPNA